MLALVHPLAQHPDSHRSSTSTRQPTRQLNPRILSNPHPSSSSSRSSSTTTSLSRNLHTVAKAPLPIPSTSQPAPSSSTSNPSSTFDIHSYPSTELLRLLASLLTQIASTNDKLSSSHSHQHSHTNALPIAHDTPIWQTLTTASRTSLSNPSSALTFHARNIPTISLEAYLLRILKYCPTTNEVFLSLLVYFDRMSKLASEATGRTFVIDSFNVHRLVIAGVTVASKFFSDVFYTNSRYAKVGGLPQPELNQLELQFLLLNDFRLVISSEEMQRYAEQLIVFSSSTPPPTQPTKTPPLPQTQAQQAQPSLHAQHHHHRSSHVPGTAAWISQQQPHTNGGAAVPIPAMGAADTYGGRISTGFYNSSVSSYPPSSSTPISTSTPPPSSSTSPSSLLSHTTHSDHKTPSVRPKTLGPYPSVPLSTPTPSPATPLDDYESENDAGGDAETETETEAETEGGWTTDDETTIRAGHSSAESESDNASLCSTGTEDGDRHEEDDDEGDLDGEEGREVEIGDVFEGSEHLDRDMNGHVEGGLPLRVEAGNGNGETEEDAEGRGERTPEQKWKKVWDGGQVRVHGEERDYAMASP